MKYTIEKVDNGFTLTFDGEEPQTFKDIVELESALLERLKQEKLNCPTCED